MTPSATNPRPQELPDIVPVFPLSGALLLPHCSLPLNIFEPRYLHMIDSAMGRGRYLGMVQPLSTGSETVGDADPVFDVGCLGRIASFAETEDGRYVISLAGCCRFTVRQEIPMQADFRHFEVRYDRFADDLDLPDVGAFDREPFVDSLERYFSTMGFDDQWRSLLELDDAGLISTTAMVCPFLPEEKQAVLECDSIEARSELIKSLIDMAFLAGQADGASAARH